MASHQFHPLWIKSCNLSGVPLSEVETNLLSRGHSFCPTPCHLNNVEIMDDLERNFRRLRLNEFFSDAEEERDDAEMLFRSPSTWMPPKGRDAALETYIKRVRTDVEHYLDHRQAKGAKDNLLPEERLTLRNLQERQDIVVKLANKGYAVVVLSRTDYINEADHQ